MIKLESFRYTDEAKSAAMLIVRSDEDGWDVIDDVSSWRLPIPADARPAADSPNVWAVVGYPVDLRETVLREDDVRRVSFCLAIRPRVAADAAEYYPVVPLSDDAWEDVRGAAPIADPPLAGDIPETVDHPAHYGGADDPYETIKVLQAWLTPDEFRGFVKGNAIKYLSRAGRKDAPAEDAAKAAWYCDVLRGL